MKKTIWFIHGANSTPICFNWMKENLFGHRAVDISYSIDGPLADTITILRKRAALCGKPPIIIGHSLGGIIALAIAQKTKVEKIVTMGSPFGGSFAASIVRWFMPTQFMQDICQQSPILSSIRTDTPKIPILSLVSDSNMSFMGENTDGVVTVKSQVALNGPIYIRIPLNHFEILLSPITIDHINSFVF